MKKCTFWIAILSLAVSLGTIAVIVMDVWEISVIDSNSFISGLVALFSLAITLLIGFQIYNSIELSDKLKEIDVLKQNIQEIRNVYELGIKKNNSEFEILRNELNESTNITLAKIYYSSGVMELDALLRLLCATKYALTVKHDEGYKWLLDEIEAYMFKIYPSSFNNGEIGVESIKITVEDFKEYIKSEDVGIKKHPNYLYIKDKYEELMNKFNVRLHLISNGKNVSDKVLDKEA
ncbi:MAG: hypothetical protein IIX13_04360 [Bacteroidales bacterium]|nr:hypothetical protein [Bacteroidales bacterium]